MSDLPSPRSVTIGYTDALSKAGFEEAALVMRLLRQGRLVDRETIDYEAAMRMYAIMD